MMSWGMRMRSLTASTSSWRYARFQSSRALLTRSASQYFQGGTLVDMIRENLVAERIAVDHYRELIRYFGDNDPGTRNQLEDILRKEEEHADDMHDLLVAHEGRPMLGKK